MVYSNKFVVCVLVNGQVQQEKADGVVPLPFNTEYTLRFRNKHNMRAVVKFTLDGENVSGDGYVIPANHYIDIKRHSNKDVGFKFVSTDSPDAVDHGKNGPNIDGSKGLIEAKFFLEKEEPVYKQFSAIWNDQLPKEGPTLPNLDGDGIDRRKTHYFRGGATKNCSPSIKKSKSTRSKNARSNVQHTNKTIPPKFNVADSLESMPVSEPFASNTDLQNGVTVEGNSTGQKFTPVYIKLEETFTMIRVVLKGFEGEFVKNIGSDYCGKCGQKKSRDNDKFCGKCGTRL